MQPGAPGDQRLPTKEVRYSEDGQTGCLIMPMISQKFSQRSKASHYRNRWQKSDMPLDFSAFMPRRQREPTGMSFLPLVQIVGLSSYANRSVFARQLPRGTFPVR